MIAANEDDAKTVIDANESDDGGMFLDEMSSDEEE